MSESSNSAPIVQQDEPEEISNEIIPIKDLSKCLSLNGTTITYGIFNNQVYINLTELCKAGGKKYNHWRSLKATQAFLQALELKLNQHNLIIYHDNGNQNRATWGHQHIAIDIAFWISPLFKVHVIDWIYTLIGLEKCFQTLGECIKNQPIKSDIGYIYCIISAIFKNNIYKIGKTKQSKKDLKQSYSRSYGNIPKLSYIKR
jgi:hypothetical protein